jgi:hypothetical protein
MSRTKRRDWAEGDRAARSCTRAWPRSSRARRLPDGSGNQVSALERARRLAFALVEGARQKSKEPDKPKEKKPA